MTRSPVIVVGTTADYIEHIRRNFPDRSLFITDPEERKNAREDRPEAAEEILCPLEKPEAVIAALGLHLKNRDLQASGVCAFDCESLELAANIAGFLRLPFPSLQAVRNCRNKFLAGRLWESAGVSCPEAVRARSLAEVLSFMERMQQPLILKPLTGSGSELVFLCKTPSECSRAFRQIQASLSQHRNLRMYGSAAGTEADSRQDIVAERFVQGDEYSCDFLLEDDCVTIIRIARKIPDPHATYGTCLAYMLPVSLPGGSGEEEKFRLMLRKASHALGLKRAVCMLDFIWENGKAVLLEMAARPGGDCIPRMILKASGLDMLGLALDFAQGKSPALPVQWEALTGFRMIARQGGIIRKTDDSRIRQDSRVLESYFKIRPGHRVILPPDDYDSRILGHVIFRQDSLWENINGIREECLALASGVHTEFQNPFHPLHEIIEK